MLPFLIGRAALAVVGYALDEMEKDNIKTKRKELQKRSNNYASKLKEKERCHREKKQSMMFSQIKSEQSKLKRERRQLAQVRNSCQRGTPMYRQIVNQMKQLQQQIDQKQHDADMVRF